MMHEYLEKNMRVEYNFPSNSPAMAIFMSLYKMGDAMSK